MITFTCPGCSLELKVKDELAGKSGKCKRCGEGIRIPAGDMVETEDPKPFAKQKQEVVAVAQREVYQERIIERSPPQPQVIQQVVYVQAPAQTRTNGVAVAALVMSILTLVLSWLPIINVILLIITAVLVLLAVLVCVFKKGAGLIYTVAAVVFGGIALFVVIAMLAAVGRAGVEIQKQLEKDRQERLNKD